MSRVHDMGGRFGDGHITPEADGIPRLPDWQWRALALTLAAGSLGKWNIDISRHARECLSPQDYARFSYFEKWLAGLADLLVESDVLSRDDLATAPAPASASAPHPLADRCLRAEGVRNVLVNGGPSDRPAVVPVAFAPGQAVRTRRIVTNRLVDGGHTRLPVYAAGATGCILRRHGTHVFPDSSAHRLGEAPEPLYAVVFSAGELWAKPEHPRDEVVLDLWQSYLEPIDGDPA